MVELERLAVLVLARDYPFPLLFIDWKRVEWLIVYVFFLVNYTIKPTTATNARIIAAAAKAQTNQSLREQIINKI